MKSPKRFAKRTVNELRAEALKLINQRAGTMREPSFGLTILDGWMKGGRETKEDYIELILFLEAGEPAEKTRAYERLQKSFRKLLETNDMATKKTTAKKTSGFGTDKPTKAAKAPKQAVDRPKVNPAEKKSKKFEPTTPAELEDIAKTATAKEEAKKSAAAKEAGKTNSAKATVKKAAAAHKEAVKKASGKKPAASAANGEKKTRGGIGALAMELIKKGLSAERVIAEVKKKFPDSAINDRHVAWYKNKMAREA